MEPDNQSQTPPKKQNFLVGLSSGILNSAVSKGAQQVGKKVAETITKVVVRGGLKAALQAAATAGDAVLPLISHAIAWAVEKFIVGAYRLIKSIPRNAAKGLVVSGAVLMAAGASLGSVGLVGAGGALSSVGLLSGGASGTIRQIPQTTQTLISGVLGLSIASFSVPLIVVLIAFPAIVALFMIVIYSGAFIVPGSPGSFVPGTISSAYVRVSKVATHPVKGEGTLLEFENEDLYIPGNPLTITYRITITAREKDIKVEALNYNCTVVQEETPPPCPQIQGEGIPNPNDISIITTDQPYTFTYTQTFDGEFEDSFVIDTISVTVTVQEDQTTSTAATSAAIKIGNPPEDCPSNWPILPEGAEEFLPINQGPYGANSHASNEAIDVGATEGHTITARHSGIAEVYDLSGGYGKHVRISSICEGKIFESIYAHLSVVGIGPGPVIMGQVVGYSGNTGNSDGPHLHYEFKPNTAIPMAPIYIPKTVPQGCSNSVACGSIP